MIYRQQELEKELQELNKQITSLPTGKLSCTLNGHHYKWRRSTETGRSNLSKKELSTAQQLAFKQFLKLQYNNKSQENEAINAYLDIRSNTSQSEIDSYLSHPEYSRLLYPQLDKKRQDALIWQSASYQKNPNYPAHLTHETITGEFVRSKSEALIYESLIYNKIPFRYECLLLLDDTPYYPDFTILHPNTNKIFYWEHFGRIDDIDYRHKNLSRLDNYIAHGIIPDNQLITTYETLDYPLSSRWINDIIRHYFLL